MKTIWKYQLDLADHTSFTAPEPAEIISIENQRGILSAWVIVDPDAPVVTRNLVVRGTGHPFQGNEGKHIATVQGHDGLLVFHVFYHLFHKAPAVLEGSTK